MGSSPPAWEGSGDEGVTGGAAAAAGGGGEGGLGSSASSSSSSSLYMEKRAAMPSVSDAMPMREIDGGKGWIRGGGCEARAATARKEAEDFGTAAKRLASLANVCCACVGCGVRVDCRRRRHGPNTQISLDTRPIFFFRNKCFAYRSTQEKNGNTMRIVCPAYYSLRSMNEECNSKFFT